MDTEPEREVRSLCLSKAFFLPWIKPQPVCVSAPWQSVGEVAYRDGSRSDQPLAGSLDAGDKLSKLHCTRRQCCDVGKPLENKHAIYSALVQRSHKMRLLSWIKRSWICTSAVFCISVLCLQSSSTDVQVPPKTAERKEKVELKWMKDNYK